MSDRKPLMPKATAVWLVENTSLSFDQIAEFCGMHLLEVKGIADGDVAQGIKGMDPIASGQLTREEIKRAETNHDHRLRLAESKVEIPQVKSKKGPRYTPVSRRHDRPNAVLWLLRNHGELRDSQIMRLVGTTKPTITQIRDRSHWNSSNLTPQDPVTLGLCSQVDLDAEVRKSAKRVDPSTVPPEPVETLLPTSQTTGGREQPPEPTRADMANEEALMMARLRQMKASEEEEVEPEDDAAAEEAEAPDTEQDPEAEAEAETERQKAE